MRRVYPTDKQTNILILLIDNVSLVFKAICSDNDTAEGFSLGADKLRYYVNHGIKDGVLNEEVIAFDER